MKRIATLTVNPAIDKNTSVGQVRSEKKLRCDRPSREPGGGGINVARAIKRLGGSPKAIYLGGGPPGQIFRELLEQEELEQQMIEVDGWTRENLIVFEESSGEQFRFGMPGPEVKEHEWRRSLDEIAHLDPRPEYLVASGSLAPGMPPEFFAHVAELARDMGAGLVVDTSGDGLRHAVETGAFLIKPNIAEFEALIGEELKDERQQTEAGQDLIDRGCCSIIVLSLGRGGALVISSAGSDHVRTPTVPIRSKVGAGDSMVGGIVLGLAREMDLLDAVRFGVAAGAAAVMTEGTELCRREDTERLFEEMTAGKAA